MVLNGIRRNMKRKGELFGRHASNERIKDLLLAFAQLAGFSHQAQRIRRPGLLEGYGKPKAAVRSVQSARPNR